MTPAAGDRPDGRAARWAGQRQRRREEFVEAAIRAIAEHGPEASTEHIAEAAGVARTRLYKHFTDATDLRRAVAERAVRQVNTELAALLHLEGTPMEMITGTIGMHTEWLSEHRHLYHYLSRHSPAGREGIEDVKTTIARRLTTLFESYLDGFGLGSQAAEPIAFGLVGLVESSTAQWLENDRGLGHAQFTALLARWVWGILDDTLRQGGITVDPHRPLPAP
ncbi:TetR/AcrR family transcriptional regulator [Amycolatopsis acidicola]|uniref:TetR/AcrR family transcriptional regulator n=1 Tax=Amycolatopsis acidicola TaxID=2596893 RepID=A0A5N0V0Z6_9PSEU|nr:TetR/AcrR family transcriptional regulator [Amycolatopsis acidicola]KAA9156660.1 TetR/AcrR family transcriptional regulator [Amycolatopsis acidicola]